MYLYYVVFDQKDGKLYVIINVLNSINCDIEC